MFSLPQVLAAVSGFLLAPGSVVVSVSLRVFVPTLLETHSLWTSVALTPCRTPRSRGLGSL